MALAFVVSAYAEEEDKVKGLDIVSDTVSTAFDKVNALLAGKLEITMAPDAPDNKDQFTTDATGRRVPKATAVKSAGSLHNDQPL